MRKDNTPCQIIRRCFSHNKNSKKRTGVTQAESPRFTDAHTPAPPFSSTTAILMSQEQLPTVAAVPTLSTMTAITNMQHKPSASPSRPTYTLSPTPLHPARAGSKSPTSIPSSPTSIRSASSAIFERDIEPLALPHSHHAHPHRTPRGTQTEQTVPSVLTEAAAALVSIENGQTGAEGISILTPQASSPPYGLALGMAMPVSPNGQFSFTFGGPGSTGIRTPAGVGSQSRSPSPSRATFASVSSPVPSASSRKTPTASPIPSPLTATSPLPNIPIASHGVSSPRQQQPSSTPPSSYSPPSMHTSPFSLASHPQSNDAGQAESPSILPPSLLNIDPSSLPPPPTRQSLSVTASDATQSKRLSFVSYSDLLYSTPVTSLPLSSLTSSASAIPPPHLPAVTNNVPIVLPSPTGGASSRPLSMYSVNARTGKQSHPSQIYAGDYMAPSDDGSRRHSMLSQGDEITQRLIDDIGGEWEREGLGKGLEERLEAVTMA